ncbi:unnamed protein product [Schistocephalus solidus]|uniref:Fibronectin type-III domain-containing protein n=1 Tax=Schistocephalus solidus TaxID=70667 RepID=A0A183ST17_SCHSO|nr:unnamed protein product [Schistocephalus solidus]
MLFFFGCSLTDDCQLVIFDSNTPVRVVALGTAAIMPDLADLDDITESTSLRVAIRGKRSMNLSPFPSPTTETADHPAIVTNVVTSVLSTESFSVNWSHPAEYNGPIGPTKLHLWTPNGMEQRKNVSHPTATETFSGLQPSLPYYVSLMATTQAEGQCSGRYGEAFLAGLVYMESKG